MTRFCFDIVGFDLDGTLLDTSGDLGDALNETLRNHGFAEVPGEAVRDLIGGGARRMLEKALALQHVTISDNDITTMNQRLVAWYKDNIARHSRLFPGGEDMLDALAQQGVQLVVVTNKLEHLAVHLLDQLGLSARFAAIIGGDTLGPGRAKPAPDLLQEMVRRAGGGSAAFVGDTTFDIGAAKAAGLPSIAVSFGFNDLPVGELGADAVIDHFDELLPALERLGRN